MSEVESNSSDWDEIVDETCDEGKKVDYEREEVTALSSFVMKSTEKGVLKRSQDDNDDEDFDDLLVDEDDIQLPSKFQSSAGDTDTAIQTLVPQSGGGSGSGLSLFTLDDMEKLMSSKEGSESAMSSQQSKHVQRPSEVSDEDCFANIDDDSLEDNLEKVVLTEEEKEEFKGEVDDTLDNRIRISDDEKGVDEIVNDDINPTVTSVKEKINNLGINVNAINEKTVNDGKEMLTNDGRNRTGGVELESWDDDFCDVSDSNDKLTGKSQLSPRAHFAITNSSSAGWGKKPPSLADKFFHKQSHIKRGQRKPRMTLITLPTHSPSTSSLICNLGKTSNNTSINSSRLLPSNSKPNDNMTYDPVKQKWVEIEGMEYEEVDWGSDDEIIVEAPKLSADAMVNNETTNDFGGGSGERIVENVRGKSTDSRSFERKSSLSDFEITEEMKANFHASVAHHDVLFNNFLGKEAYERYIEKFSKANQNVPTDNEKVSSCNLCNRNTGSKYADMNSASKRHDVGNRDPTRGFSIQQKLMESNKATQNSSRNVKCMNSKKDIETDIKNFRITSATKVGSRKQHMLTEIWQVSRFCML